MWIQRRSILARRLCIWVKGAVSASCSVSLLMIAKGAFGRNRCLNAVVTCFELQLFLSNMTRTEICELQNTGRLGPIDYLKSQESTGIT